MSDTSVCFSGRHTVDMGSGYFHLKRAKLERMARQCGFQPQTNVTIGLKYLVVPDRKHDSTKVRQAKEYGYTSVIPIKQFVNMLVDHYGLDLPKFIKESKIPYVRYK